MSPTLVTALITDLAGIILLAYGLYFRRHRRRDLLLSYLALNIGVFALTMALSTVEAGIGLGMGLFGILSIIRLRSDQITQQEIAYYFTALAMGLLSGLHPDPAWVTPALTALMLAVILVADSPVLHPRTHRHTMTLDHAYTTPAALTAALEQALQAHVVRVELLDVDLVRDISVVDVRYRDAVPARSGSSADRGLSGVVLHDGRDAGQDSSTSSLAGNR